MCHTMCHRHTTSTNSMLIELIEPSKIRQSHLVNLRRSDNKDDPALAQLAQLERSLKSIGQIQPIICRVTGYRKKHQVDEIIECISGLRRLRIAQEQKLPRIKAIIYGFQQLSDVDVIELFIADNPHLSQKEKNDMILRLFRLLEDEKKQKPLNSNTDKLLQMRIERIAQIYQVELMQPTT